MHSSYCGHTKSMGRSMAAVSPLHQGPPHPDSAFNAFSSSSNSALNATRTSSFAAALRKLAKQAVDPIIEKELSPITPVTSPAVSQHSLSAKRTIPSLYETSSIASPPVVTIAPTQTHGNHLIDSRKSAEVKHSQSIASSSRNVLEPVSLNLEVSKSIPINLHSDKRTLGTNHFSESVSSHGRLLNTRTHSDDDLTSSRSFQPYKNVDELHHSIPPHISSYDHPSAAASMPGYPYHPTFLPPHHIPHPPYRMDGTLYLDYGLLRPSMIHLPSPTGMLPHPSVPFYPGNRYPPELLTQSLGLVSPSNTTTTTTTTTFNTERIKLEEEQRQREKDAIHEQEREQEWEREQRESEDRARNDYMHGQSPLPLTINKRAESPANKHGSITQGTPRDLIIKKSSSSAPCPVPLNLATHSGVPGYIHNKSHHETEMWLSHQQAQPNGVNPDLFVNKNGEKEGIGFRHPMLMHQEHFQVCPSEKILEQRIPEKSIERHRDNHPKDPYYYHASEIHHKNVLNTTESTRTVEEHTSNPEHTEVFSSEKYNFQDSHIQEHNEKRILTSDSRQTSVPIEGRMRNNNESYQTSGREFWKPHFQKGPMHSHSLESGKADDFSDSSKLNTNKNHQHNLKGMSNIYVPQPSHITKDASITRAILENHILSSLSGKVPELCTRTVSKLDMREEKIRRQRVNGFYHSEESQSDSEDEEVAKLSHVLFISKGPPMKFDSNPKKAKFLKMFDLTTHPRKRMIELKKYLRHRRILRERSKSPQEHTEDKNEVVYKPSIHLTKKTVCQLECKEDFLKFVDLVRASTEKQKEKERLWRVLLEDRKKRNGVARLYTDTKEHVHTDELKEGARGIKRKLSKERNIANSVLSEKQYCHETNSSAIKVASVGPVPRHSSSRMLLLQKPATQSSKDPSLIPPLVSSSACSSHQSTAQQSGLCPFSLKDKKLLDHKIDDHKEEKNIAQLHPLMSTLHSHQLRKDFAQEFHESVLQTTQRQLEQKSHHSSQNATGDHGSTFQLSDKPSNSSKEKDTEEHSNSYKWPGIEAIMESYETYISEQTLEKEFLSERCQQLQQHNQHLNSETECLGKRFSEFLQLKKHLDMERHDIQIAIDNLKQHLQQMR